MHLQDAISAVQRQQHSAAQLEPHQTSAAPAHAPAFSAGPFTGLQYQQLLVGMLAKGHGAEAICLFLALTRDMLLDMVVEFGLPTPHDRPLRRTGGKRAWTGSDYAVLLSGWLGSWQTHCIAQQMGCSSVERSPGSVWAKARRLGLPRRDRSALIWPDLRLPEPPVVVEPPPDPVIAKQSPALPSRWLVTGTDETIEIVSKTKGHGVNWEDNAKALVFMSMCVWGGVRLAKIAEMFGVSYRTVTSQLNWLEAKSQPRHKQVDHYDRAVAEANIARAGYKLVYCRSNPKFPYWTARRCQTNSKRDKKTSFYDACYG